MSNREADTATTIAAIASIALIIVACLCFHVDETLIKLGLVAIAGIAGFSLNNLIRRS
jgi:uncharacterized membrane protein YgdD (TMEM256/DUF423 family)